jgi:hypothetical protein
MKKRHAFKNATMATTQVGISFFALFRFLLGTIGIEKVGIWSLVLATTNVTRISELGFADSLLQFVSRSLANSTPGFTPGSLPVLIPVPGPSGSHSIAIGRIHLPIVSKGTA